MRDYAPELWVTVTNKARTKSRQERIHGWQFTTTSWLLFRRGVEAVRDIVSARDEKLRWPETARVVARGYLARHLRNDPLPNDDPNDPAPGLTTYFVRRGAGRYGAEEVSSVNTEGTFDSPDVLMAYALASLWEPNVVAAFGGRCPICMRLTGRTPKGKPKVGLCGKCKMALWRAEQKSK